MNVWNKYQLVWSGFMGILGIATLACGTLQAQPADNAVPGVQLPSDAIEVQRARQQGAANVQGGPSVVRAQGFQETVRERHLQSNDQDMARQMQVQVRRATEGLRGAQNESDKTAAMRQLTQVLNEYFEADLKWRTNELAQIEERVRTLREQLDRRREKKQEIIDLQIKVAQNEADGLGFFGVTGGGSTGLGTYTTFGVAGPMEVSPDRGQPRGPQPAGRRGGGGAVRQGGQPQGERERLDPAGPQPVNPPGPGEPRR
jgi:hypothetical protein